MAKKKNCWCSQFKNHSFAKDSVIFRFYYMWAFEKMNNEIIIIWFIESKKDGIELKFIFPLNLLNEMINHSAVYNYFVHSDTQLEKD